MRESMLMGDWEKDKTFTATLFAPTAEFAKLGSQQEFVEWFRLQFPDALELIGEKELSHDFVTNSRNPLIHIKV